MTVPSVDGSVVKSAGFNNTSAVCPGLTTTAAGMIVVSVASENSSVHVATGFVSSITDTAGLTWKRRWQNVAQSSGDDYRNQEVWWAMSPGVQSSDVITVNFNTAMDGAAIVAFGVKNATGWDPNLQLPQTGVDTQNETYNTDNADSLVLVFQQGNGAGNVGSIGGGGGPATFTLLNNVRDTSGFGNQGNCVWEASQATQIVAGTISGSTGYNQIVDVITNDSATPHAAPTLDGSNYQFIPNGVNTLSSNLSTTQAGEIVVLVMSQTNSGGGVGSTVSSVTASGLTFTKRGSYLGHGSSGSGTQLDLEEWVAPTTGAFLGSITVNLNANVDAGAIFYQGFANLSGPFDANASVPGFAANDNVASLTTDNADDILLWASTSVSNGGESGMPSGFTQLGFGNSNVGFTGIGMRVAIERVNATLSSATISAGSAGTNVANMVDALQFGSAPPLIVSMGPIRARTYLRR